jgi:CheY-like chemotaxis protein
MSDQRQKTVLVVEDEPLVQMMVADLLSELGYSTVVASDAKSALAALDAHNHVDLLLTDIGLPGADGWSLAESARRLRPSLPVLFATGYGEDPQRRLGPGMAMIGKPFDTTRLAAALRKLTGLDHPQ